MPDGERHLVDEQLVPREPVEREVGVEHVVHIPRSDGVALQGDPPGEVPDGHYSQPADGRGENAAGRVGREREPAVNEATQLVRPPTRRGERRQAPQYVLAEAVPECGPPPAVPAGIQVERPGGRVVHIDDLQHRPEGSPDELAAGVVGGVRVGVVVEVHEQVETPVPLVRLDGASVAAPLLAVEGGRRQAQLLDRLRGRVVRAAGETGRQVPEPAEGRGGGEQLASGVEGRGVMNECPQSLGVVAVDGGDVVGDVLAADAGLGNQHADPGLGRQLVHLAEHQLDPLPVRRRHLHPGPGFAAIGLKT